ncbi:MAG: peptide-methionine (S)-S-oxide reductase MsrA, partial [Pseudomonadales bacterium]|nr:peptide-methionine (S)-S-oxide reductase MsrA [Pseudomonadales bacterium]
MKRWSIFALGAIAAGLWFLAMQATQSADRVVKPATANRATAVFAGGCFWCMEKPFDALVGVSDTTSGYAGGHQANPTYEEVSSGTTGHAESIQITYDPAQVSYQQLLEVFWRNVDPFDAAGQFCDRGSQYRSAIFVANTTERQAAEASKAALEKRFARKIATQIVAATTFYPAEDYHQNY